MRAATPTWILLLRWSVLGLILVLPFGAVAQEEETTTAEESVTEEGQEAEEGEEGEEVELTAMQKIRLATVPGEPHELLEPLIGEWDLTYRVWMTVEGEPVETYGSAVSRWILEKRFVRMVYQGEILGRDFEGQRVIGYDNQAQEYVATWRDNLGTYTLLFKGRCDDVECRQRTMTADFVDPVSNQSLKNKGIFHLGRPEEPEIPEGEVEAGGEEVGGEDEEEADDDDQIVRRIVWSDDDDAFTYEAFLVTKDGKEFKTLEIVAERR